MLGFAKMQFLSRWAGRGRTAWEEDGAVGVDEVLYEDSGAAPQLARQAMMLSVRVHTRNRPSRVRIAHLPSILHPPKGSFGPWRSKH